ncbi:MAG: SDR family NAD(P)-dependent oxidoreductase [Pseudomonadales bacterium]|nr:SDR family NAD(P)-dependent oxidoreductase [Pseudomonadales bacterium]
MTSILEKIHALMTGSKMAAVKDLTGRSFLVTGCAQGSLGFSTALQLLQQGAVVSITTRKNTQAIKARLQEKLSPIQERNLHAFDLDLASRDSVEAFVDVYKTSNLGLDVLINNAGIHLDLMSKWRQPLLSDDGFEMQWRVNYLGSTHLTLSLLPLLQTSAKTSGDARIINVISQLHTKGLNSEFFTPQRPYNSWFAYGQSKLALLHFTRSLDRRFNQDSISSYCLHPGAVYTNVAAKGLADTGWVETIRNALAPLERCFLKTAREGAQTQIHCATSDKKILRSGQYYRNSTLSIASSEGDDVEIADKLWQEQLQWMANKAA